MTKDHILSEIRRVAEANGGVAPGKHTFLSETGIKESDWHGKYWARWSDAVREAGYSANTIQRPYDETELFEAYVRLAREIGRLPVNGEMRLKSRDDSTFPAARTFWSRLGGKSEMVARVLAYCRSRAGYEDVVRLCEGYVPADDGSEETPGPSADVEGYVYLLKSGRFYKIGRSNAAGRREYELGLQLPEPAAMVHKIRTDDPVGIEAYWHRRFESKRKNGEWFDLDAASVAAFKRRKFM